MIRVLTCISYQDSSLLIDYNVKCRIYVCQSLNKGEKKLKVIEMVSKDIELRHRIGNIQPVFQSDSVACLSCT